MDVRLGGASGQDTLWVNWTAYGKSTGFEVQWRVADGEWRSLPFVTAVSANRFAAFGLTSDIPIGTRIGARVRTVLDSAASEWSAEVTYLRPRAFVSCIPSKAETGGIVELIFFGWVSSLSPSAPDLYLYTGDRLIAHMGKLPWSRMAWNTFDYPEGNQVLNVRLADGSPSPDLALESQPIRVNRKVHLFWNPTQGQRDLYVQDTPITLSFDILVAMVDAPIPSSARIWAGGILLAEFHGPPPWPTVTWNTRDAPEGDYPIRVEIPNYSPEGPDSTYGRTSWTPFDVHVDRTAPRVTCIPPALGQATGWTNGIVTLLSNEITSIGGVVFSANGKTFTAVTRKIGFESRWEFRIGPDVPRPFHFEIGGSNGVDLAGNPAVMDCAFDVPAWLAPLGVGPITVGGEVVTASSFDLLLQTSLESPVTSMVAGWIPAGGSTTDGRPVAAVSAGGVFPAGQVVGTAGAQATSVSASMRWWNSIDRQPWLAWTERAPGTPDAVHVASWTGTAWAQEAAARVGQPGRAAKGVVLAMGHIVEGDGAAVWEEADSSGFRSVVARRLVAGSWVDVGGDLATPAGAGTDSPALVTTEFGSSTTGFPSLVTAYLATSPGGVPQVRVARAFPGTGWMPFPGAENRDPTASASEPTVIEQVEVAVAWVEAGQVLVRQTDVLNWWLEFGNVTVLNRDPARKARSPRGAKGHGTRYPVTIFFVEEGLAGDEIWARRWNGTTWDLLPGPVNAGVAGQVIKLTVNSDPLWVGASIAWIDGDGHVHVRRENL